MLRLVAACAALAFLVAATASHGQDAVQEKQGAAITDEAAREAIKVALSRIHLTNCDADKPCAPASDSEYENPPISIADARAAMAFAITSAIAQWCGLDWKRSFLPMIALAKGSMKMDPRQLQLMTLIHGDLQTRQLASYAKSGQCPDTLREQLDGQLPKL